MRERACLPHPGGCWHSRAMSQCLAGRGFLQALHSCIPPFSCSSITCLLSTYCVPNIILDVGAFFLKTRSDHVIALLYCFKWLPIAKGQLQVTHTMSLPTCMLLLFKQFPSLDDPSSWSRCLEMSLPLWRCHQTPLISIPAPSWHNAPHSVLTWHSAPPLLLHLWLLVLVHCLCGFLSCQIFNAVRQGQCFIHLCNLSI